MSVIPQSIPLWWQNCHRYQRHRRQIFPPVSLALLIPVANNRSNYQTANNLKWTRKKNYLYANWMTQRCPKEIIKNFLKKDYFHRCRWHQWQTFSCEYLREIRNGPNGIIRGLGETDSWKKTRSKKSRDTVPLKTATFRPLKWRTDCNYTVDLVSYCVEVSENVAFAFFRHAKFWKPLNKILSREVPLSLSSWTKTFFLVPGGHARLCGHYQEQADRRTAAVGKPTVTS